MSVTVKDVAAQSGLSVTTVVHILGKHGARYSDKTRERVLAVAKGLGYRPNASARATFRGRFDCLALVLSTEQGRSNLSKPALEGLCAAAERHDCHLTVTRLADEMMDDPRSFPKALRQLMSDGLLVNYNTLIPPRLIQLIRDYRLPCIWMRSKHPADCVYPDEHGVGFKAARHLIGLGHRRIAYADYGHGADGLSTGHFGAIDCEAGYREAMREAGLEPVILRERDYVPRTARPGLIRRVLEGPSRPTGLITYAINTALPVVYAALRLGLEIPRDLSLITYGTECEDSMGLAMTTMVTPEREFGTKAVELLLAKIRNPELSLEPVQLMCRLEPGETCAPPPG